MDQRQTGIYFLDRGVYGRAERYLRQWVLSHPHDTYLHMELVWCFYKHHLKYFDEWQECDKFYEEFYNGLRIIVLAPG